VVNTCYDGNWWFKEQDEEGNFLDHDGNIIYTWMAWTDHMGQSIDDQMCATKAATLAEAATAASTAISTAISNLPAPSAPTAAQVKTALGAPAPAITTPTGAPLLTLQVLGLTVLAGSTVSTLENAITRINEIEARLKTLGLLL